MANTLCIAISVILFLVGIIPGGEVLVSLPYAINIGWFPFIPGVGIYPAEIRYDVSFAGRLNDMTSDFQALTSLHVSLAALLLNYDRFVYFSVQLGNW